MNIRHFRHLRTLHLIAALGLPFGAAVVIACGPDFPLQVLDDRAGTLKATPANSFVFEVSHLVKANDKIETKETPSYGDPATATPADVAFLTPAQRDKLKAVRALTDGDAAYALGADLPPAVRLYAAGAVDYRASQGKAADAGLAARAQQRFQSVIDLPKADGDTRAVWAAYMLGKTHANAMPGAGNDAAAERNKAAQAYALARSRAAAGALDTAGLAVASLGEQALLPLAADGAFCAYEAFSNKMPCADRLAAGDIKQAIRLYVEQAAHNSNSGVQSLRVIAEWALSDPVRAQKLIDDPVAQRLLVSFALARLGDIVGDRPDSANDYFTGDRPGYADAARGGKNTKINPVLPSLVAALQKQGIDRIADIDRVAALAYRAGRYDLAQQLADQQRSALSSWVRAKLALRKGDLAAAAQAYAEASKAFPQSDASVEPASAGLIKAEQGVLMLSRGQYVEAFDQLYSVTRLSQDGDNGRDGRLSHPLYSDYAGDTWYLAERVLTTDELKTYVDAHVPATPVPAAPAGFPAIDDRQYYDWLSAHPRQTADYLRRLLARRLVRDGRVADAIAYFPDDKDVRYVERIDTDNKMTLATWRYRQLAKAYGDALNDANGSWRAVNRAAGWYKAATIAREYGMEIMGYEQSPDYAEFGGALGFGRGRNAPGDVFSDAGKQAAAAKTPEQRAAADLPGPFVSDDERKRYAASESKPNQRYHYRNIAIGYIMKAADNLPPRSQAFAAVLCKGTSFVFYDGKLADMLYRRYVKQGAAVPFAADFGQNCVEPDFRAAGRFPYVQAWKQTRRWVSAHRYATAAIALAVMGLLAAATLAWQRRRRQAAAAAAEQ